MRAASCRSRHHAAHRWRSHRAGLGHATWGRVSDPLFPRGAPMRWRPRSRTMVAVLAVAGVRATVVASPALTAAPGASAPAAERSLSARAARFPRVQSAQAEFTQERVVSLMDEVLRATGHIDLRAPDTMRFTLAEPERLTIAAHGAHVRVSDAKGAALPI